jgi:hypothetical protein
LAQLNANGYKIVQVTAKDPVKILPKYDEAIMKEFGGSTVSARPTLKRRAHRQRMIGERTGV